MQIYSDAGGILDYLTCITNFCGAEIKTDKKNKEKFAGQNKPKSSNKKMQFQPV